MKAALAVSLAVATVAACGPAEVVVTVEIDVNDPAGGGSITRALSDLEVRLLPYDRDAAFDSMAAAHPTPEPEVPSDLLAARDQMRSAQTDLEQAQLRANRLGDSLRSVRAVLQPLDRADARYALLSGEASNLERQLPAAETRANEAFIRFDSLRSSTVRASDSVRRLQETWRDVAFADVNAVFEAKVGASGLDVAVDTTDASGVARTNLRVRPGRYWVYARYGLPDVELYWNVPVTVERRESVPVRLTRVNAEERIRLQ